MQKQLTQLRQFNNAFGVEYRTEPSRQIPLEVINLRDKLMNEELREWKEAAMFEEPISHRAKELADLLYVTFGTILAEGLTDHIERVFDAVHESNMSKLGADGKPIRREDKKVLKGPNYKEPELHFLDK